MALASHYKGNLMPSEVNFLAENEYITILPRYSMKKIDLIGTKVPNLRSMRREKVPLWIAMILKSQDKCNIVPPDWLTLDNLKAKYDEEVKIPNQFSKLPWNWLETSKILLAKAPDDLQDPSHQLRSVIQDLREIRLVKSQRGLKELNESNIQLDGLSLMEINELRPYVITVMNKLRQLHDAAYVDSNLAQEDGDLDDQDEEYEE